MKTYSILFILLFKLSGHALEIHAHRGGSSLYEENSLAAIVDGLKKGSSAVEFDIHLTKDDQFVITHDPLISKEYCSSPIEDQLSSFIVRELTLEQVKTFKCNKRPDVFAPEEIATLEEVLKETETYTNQKLNIEIKYYDSLIKKNYRDIYKRLYPSVEEISLHLDKILKEYEAHNRSIIQSFSKDVLIAMKKKSEAVITSFLYFGHFKRMSLPGVLSVFIKSMDCDKVCWIPNYRKALKLMKEEGFDYFAPNFEQASHFLYKRSFKRHILKKKSFKIIPWTINKYSEMEKAINDYHVDGIITDKPELLIDNEVVK